MDNKKLTVKRIILFYVIAFLPLAVITPILCRVYGEPIFSSEKENVAAVAYVFGTFGMFAPTIANLLTRWITKEGMDNSYLALHLKGNMKYYVASVGIKMLEAVTGLFLVWKIFFGDIPLGEMYPGEGMSQKIAMVVLQLACSVILFFPAFGEEWGWRGYLGPKLEQVMSKPAAIFVGGVLWGLWHAPLTIAGHNFGVDYPLYPWLGIGVMCLMCICFNAFLTLLTESTKSIYPAAFAHMINNNCSVMVLMSLFATEDMFEKMQTIPSIRIFLAFIPLYFLVGGVSFLIYVYRTRNLKIVQCRKSRLKF